MLHHEVWRAYGVFAQKAINGRELPHKSLMPIPAFEILQTKRPLK